MSRNATASGPGQLTGKTDLLDDQDRFASSFDELNALEIAAVSGAKKFLSQRVVQKIVESIWRGDIIFWETLSVDSVKEAKVYNPKYASIVPTLLHSRFQRRTDFFPGKPTCTVDCGCLDI